MFAYIPDILLIAVTACTCFYCLVLARRLKKLQSLEGGVGASILALTSAVAKTNSAAVEARRSTEASVEQLQNLLALAESTLPLLEARTQSLHNARKAADISHVEIKEIMTTMVEPGLQNVQKSSNNLLQIVRAVKSYEARNRAKSLDAVGKKPEQKTQRRIPEVENLENNIGVPDIMEQGRAA